MGEPIELGPLFPDRESGEPLGQQLVRRLRAAIESSVFPPGAKLLPSRELARRLGISRNTVTFALDQLVSEGYVEARVGSGTFVAQMITKPRSVREGVAHTMPSRAQRLLSLTSGLEYYADRREALRVGSPDLTLFPRSVWEALTRRHLREFGDYLDYGPTLGLPSLRDAIAQHVRQFRGVAIATRNIIVVEGTQVALRLIADVLSEPGQRIVVEDPSYILVVRLFELLGLDIMPVDVDDQGLRIEEAPAASLVYVTPSHQFPLGGVMSRRRRAELLEWAVEHNAYIIEDDYDGEYYFGAKPLPALHALDRDERVIYLGTFSKSLAPGLRTSYLVVPDHLLEAFWIARRLTSLGSPPILQATLASFIAEGHFARHIHRTTPIYESRREALVQTLKETALDRIFTLNAARTGLHLAVRALQPFADVAIATSLRDDITVYPLSSCCLERSDCSGFLLGYSAAPADEVKDAVRRLATAVLSR
jgi:GntR family transcriptional regulator/MocR family aminotransferase